MHLTFLTSEYPHERVSHVAGIGTSIKNLVVALSQLGVKVTVVVYGQKENIILEENGVSIHLIKHKKYKMMGWYWHRKYLKSYLNRLILSEKIDAIEAPDWTGITAFMKLKAPLVIRFHGSDTYFCHLEQRKQKWKNYWFEKLAVNKAVAYIAPTTYAGQVSKELFHIKGKPIQTIHYGLALENFENEKPTQFNRWTILYIGTIIRKKGVFELPSIVQQVQQQQPEARVLLIGADAPDVQTNNKSTWELLQKEFENKGCQNVHYLGKIPYHQVQQHIKEAHACVFPSYAETLGMVTIESMALRKSVVNTSIGWAQELIEEGISGYLVHPSNHNAFSEKIITILENDALAATMGEQARKRVETIFDIKKIAQQNLVFYQSLLAKS
jgi:glycosyltransferase involved in cell wall biosynthesis